MWFVLVARYTWCNFMWWSFVNVFQQVAFLHPTREQPFIFMGEGLCLKKKLTNFDRKCILTCMMQKLNNLVLQFSTTNFSNNWRKITDFSCAKRNSLIFVSLAIFFLALGKKRILLKIPVNGSGSYSSIKN